MLAYFSYGPREYNKIRPRHHHRQFWEFQAVVQGRIAQYPLGSDPDKLQTQASTLWVSPPGSNHSWWCDDAGAATIVVFHFTHIPESLSAKIAQNQSTMVPLSRREVAQLKELAEKVQSYWDNASSGMLLCYDYALAALCLTTHEALAQERPLKERERVELRVENALQAYQEAMAHNPSLTDIAQRTHCSPAHLRRLFHQAYQCSPKKLFDRLRYQRAMQLLTETNLPLWEIAEQCGFQDQSAFSRAFKHQFHYSPSEMRGSRS